MWLCTLIADKTVVPSLDIMAEEVALAAIANGTNPRDVFVNNR